MEQLILFETDFQFSFLSLKPFTGRKHQIRVHCASQLQAPILGDEKYGSPYPSSLDVCIRVRYSSIVHSQHFEVHGLQLHARELSMTHPINKGLFSCVSPIPKHMKHAIDGLGFVVDYRSLQPTLETPEGQGKPRKERKMIKKTTAHFSKAKNKEKAKKKGKYSKTKTI